MDQVVASNAVDYNTNDSKYMYDDFTENDYIATGDIVTTSTITPIMNTQTHYTNSLATDGTNIILNDQILSGTNNQIGKYTTTTMAGANDVPVSQNTLNNHKTNLYCDSTAYDLIDTQHHDDESNKIGNNNYLRDHMYNDRFLDTSGNIVFNQNQSVSVDGGFSLSQKLIVHFALSLSFLAPQDLDPNEVYREDYEEDVIQNQGLQTGYNDSYNNQYQSTYYNQTDKTPYYNQNDKTPYYNQNEKTPYFNYQEDYFNEEDEYKYLEEEREEMANLKHQKPDGPQNVMIIFFAINLLHSKYANTCHIYNSERDNIKLYYFRPFFLGWKIEFLFQMKCSIS